ncbi:protein of unknown function [Sinosporangium album]|uniref:Uncharacterized protein n=1 Tax=Sinosporangium album TaxID=504805 RepID=A0A1G8EJ33_9ACTN|nr:3'-5' exoribonuclease [Sinosporangium album]SDH69877.1 protein of unknown function [Sinosporangium album]
MIARLVEAFVAATPEPELWAYYGSYDFVALCQLYGRMIDLPAGFPMSVHDLKQEHARLGSPALPTQTIGHHNALADAHHNKLVGEFLTSLSATNPAASTGQELR